MLWPWPVRGLGRVGRSRLSPVSWASNHETLRTWVREAEQAEAGAGGLSASEREELKRLRRRVSGLETEKKILRKAAAYFAKEMDR
jgi:transposase